ncbi:MAG: hypothetical protein A3H79_04430 [Candidatus Levybacteria bacterium RIFCSPLOWO2_02_FULL_36_8b]|nr:MAG: hypothetical protein A3H79_04430 [Candidatus Levybacteria bacterium RIFCSPLOWO2_02_FULL_36_8b]
MEESFFKKYWIYVFLGIIAANSLILDFYLLFSGTQSSLTVLPENTNSSVISPNSCPQSCTDQINLAISSQETNISPTAKPTATQVVSPTPTSVPTAIPASISVNAVSEFFVPFGAGTGSSADWTVIDGSGAKIDPSDYGDIKQITFEVSARIPTGNQIIWIRLYNANTYQAVAGSEVTLSGGTATLLISSPIKLTSGNNLYQIQMKTQLKYPANIDMARLRIKTN